MMTHDLTLTALLEGLSQLTNPKRLETWYAIETPQLLAVDATFTFDLRRGLMEEVSRKKYVLPFMASKRFFQSLVENGVQSMAIRVCEGIEGSIECAAVGRAATAEIPKGAKSGTNYDPNPSRSTSNPCPNPSNPTSSKFDSNGNGNVDDDDDVAVNWLINYGLLRVLLQGSFRLTRCCDSRLVRDVAFRSHGIKYFSSVHLLDDMLDATSLDGPGNGMAGRLKTAFSWNCGFFRSTMHLLDMSHVWSTMLATNKVFESSEIVKFAEFEALVESGGGLVVASKGVEETNKGTDETKETMGTEGILGLKDLMGSEKTKDTEETGTFQPSQAEPFQPSQAEPLFKDINGGNAVKEVSTLEATDRIERTGPLDDGLVDASPLIEHNNLVERMPITATTVAPIRLVVPTRPSESIFARPLTETIDQILARVRQLKLSKASNGPKGHALKRARSCCRGCHNDPPSATPLTSTLASERSSLYVSRTGSGEASPNVTALATTRGHPYVLDGQQQLPPNTMSPAMLFSPTPYVGQVSSTGSASHQDLLGTYAGLIQTSVSPYDGSIMYHHVHSNGHHTLPPYPQPTYSPIFAPGFSLSPQSQSIQSPSLVPQSFLVPTQSSHTSSHTSRPTTMLNSIHCPISSSNSHAHMDQGEAPYASTLWPASLGSLPPLCEENNDARSSQVRLQKARNKAQGTLKTDVVSRVSSLRSASVDHPNPHQHPSPNHNQQMQQQQQQQQFDLSDVVCEDLFGPSAPVFDFSMSQNLQPSLQHSPQYHPQYPQYAQESHPFFEDHHHHNHHHHHHLQSISHPHTWRDLGSLYPLESSLFYL